MRSKIDNVCLWGYAFLCWAGSIVCQLFGLNGILIDVSGFFIIYLGLRLIFRGEVENDL